MRKLADIQEEAEKLSVEEQIELAHRLLYHARRARGGQEALLSKAVLARDWLTEEEDHAWASLRTVSVPEAVQGLRELRNRYRVSPGEIRDMIEEGRQ